MRMHPHTNANAHTQGHTTKLFNVGSYRRLQRGQDEVQDAAFFDQKNEVRAGGAQATWARAPEAMPCQAIRLPLRWGPVCVRVQSAQLS